MNSSTRRMIGFLAGFTLGLAYSLVTNTINRLILPDITFYDPNPGWVALIIGSSLLSGVLGLITVWSEETFIGLLISSLLGSIISLLWAWITNGTPIIYLLITLFIFLPRLFMYFPLGIGVHWIVRQWQRIYLVDRKNPGKVLVPIACLLLSFGAGLFSIYPKESRFALVKTDQLIQQGLLADRYQDLPGPLKDIVNFLDLATEDYSLEVSFEPDRLPVRRSAVEYGRLVTLIIVRFSNGFMIGCVFTPPSEVPACGNFNQRSFPFEIVKGQFIGWQNRDIQEKSLQQTY